MGAYIGVCYPWDCCAVHLHASCCSLLHLGLLLEDVDTEWNYASFLRFDIRLFVVIGVVRNDGNWQIGLLGLGKSGFEYRIIVIRPVIVARHTLVYLFFGDEGCPTIIFVGTFRFVVILAYFGGSNLITLLILLLREEVEFLLESIFRRLRWATLLFFRKRRFILELGFVSCLVFESGSLLHVSCLVLPAHALLEPFVRLYRIELTWRFTFTRIIVSSPVLS